MSTLEVSNVEYMCLVLVRTTLKCYILVNEGIQLTGEANSYKTMLNWNTCYGKAVGQCQYECLVSVPSHWAQTSVQHLVWIYCTFGWVVIGFRLKVGCEKNTKFPYVDYFFQIESVFHSWFNLITFTFLNEMTWKQCWFKPFSPSGLAQLKDFPLKMASEDSNDPKELKALLFNLDFISENQLFPS